MVLSLCCSFPDPTPDEGHSRRVSFTSGAGRHGACLPVLCSLLEGGPGEQGEFYSLVWGSDRGPSHSERTDTAQSLFSSPSAGCEAGGPALSQCVHVPLYVPVLFLPPWRSLSVLSTFHSLGRGIPPGPQLLKDTRSQKGLCWLSSLNIIWFTQTEIKVPH